MDFLSGWFSSGEHGTPPESLAAVPVILASKNKSFWIKCYHHDNAPREWSTWVVVLLGLVVFSAGDERIGHVDGVGILFLLTPRDVRQ